MRRRLSIRARVAVWCAALAIVTGAVGVVASISYTARDLRKNAASVPFDTPNGRTPRLATRTPGTSTGQAPRPAIGSPGNPNAASRDPFGGDPLGLGPNNPNRPRDVPGTNLTSPIGRAAEGRRVGAIISRSRRTGLLVVLGLAGLSVLTAWLAAGRMLRPVRRIRDAAARVSVPGVGHRIGLDGPNDELHQLSDSIDEMLSRLDQSFETQRRFVADASHELRTPLAVLTTEVEVALDDDNASTQDLRASMRRVRDELRRTRSLVESLLHLSRADTLATIVAHNFADSAEQAIAATKRLRLGDRRFVADLGDAPVSGDPVLLDRLVLNLVENAARYNVDDGLITVSTTTAGDRATLIVENDGPVITDTAASQLFERFRRGTPTRERTDGHGLGLSIVQAIVTTHGGTIHLLPRQTGGLRAEVRLPRR